MECPSMRLHILSSSSSCFLSLTPFISKTKSESDESHLSSSSSLPLVNGLEPTALDKAFPFHIIFNKKLDIIQAGQVCLFHFNLSFIVLILNLLCNGAVTSKTDSNRTWRLDDNLFHSRISSDSLLLTMEIHHKQMRSWSLRTNSPLRQP